MADPAPPPLDLAPLDAPFVSRTVYFAHPDVTLATLLANRTLSRCRLQPVSLHRIFGASTRALRLRRIVATLIVAATDRRFTRTPLTLVLRAPPWAPPGFALSETPPPATPNVFCEEGAHWWAAEVESSVTPIVGTLLVDPGRPTLVAEYPEASVEELSWAMAMVGGVGPTSVPPIATPWPDYWSGAMHRLFPRVVRNRHSVLAASPAPNEATMTKLKAACVDEHIQRAPYYVGLDGPLEMRLDWPEQEWAAMEARARSAPATLGPTATVAVRFEAHLIR